MRHVVAILVLSLALARTASAGGNILPLGTNDAANAGRGGAGNAVGDSVYHNPANISQKQRLKLNFYNVIVQSSYQRTGWSEAEDAETGFFPMPVLALSNRLSDKLTISNELYPADGLGIKYAKGPYRKSLLMSYNLTLVMAYQATDTLALGIGGDLVYGKLVSHSIFDQLGIPVNSVFLENDVDGWGKGFRLGARWQPCDWLTLGASYASPRKVDMAGHTEVSLFGFNVARLKPKTSVVFPGRIGLGVAIKPADTWLVAADFNWYDYSGLDKIKFNFDWFSLSQNTNWGNNKSAHLGVEKDLKANWKLRFGAAILWPAVPPKTMNPIIPDGIGYCGTAGLGWLNNRRDLAIDIAVVYGEAHRKTSPAWGRLMPGDYDEEIFIFSASISRYF